MSSAFAGPQRVDDNYWMRQWAVEIDKGVEVTSKCVRQRLIEGTGPGENVARALEAPSLSFSVAQFLDDAVSGVLVGVGVPGVVECKLLS